MTKQRFNITGMSCAACASRVDKAVRALPGVAEATVNLLKNSLSVRFDEAVVSAEQIAAAVEKAGYGAIALDGRPSSAPAKAQDSAAGEIRALKLRLIFSCLFALPLFYLAMGPMLGLPQPFAPGQALPLALTQLLLALAVMAVNSKYYKVGFRALISGSPNMDSLIAVGSSAAAVFGLHSVYKMAFALGRGDVALAEALASNLYFDSAAMILTLITLGKFFEARAKGRSSEAIAKLLDLAPKTATLIRDGQALTVPVEELKPGDLVEVKAGEAVPADGFIEEGQGFLDESALSGESLPQEKSVGAELTGATINISGHFLMRVRRVGEDSTLAQIVRLVDEASASKAPIARLADRVSGFFVPLVMLIALAAALSWLALGYNFDFALSIGISVLVISCPCALGLATPTAIMVGTGRGAALGILFKSAEAIERLQQVDTVLLDKTGTITEGQPRLTLIEPLSPGGEAELLSLAASLERLSEHPLAAAIVREAQDRGLQPRPVDEFRQIPGQGLSGLIDGRLALAGNARLLETQAIAAPELEAKALALAAEGHTVLYFAWGGRPLGLLALADVVKPHSSRAVAELKALGLDLVMLTGDKRETAAAIASQAGVDKVLAELLPQDKDSEIRRLQAQGRRIAMVGDGVNDAPALARADVGLAIGAGTDIAIESADVVLMRSELLDAVAAVELSRAVMRNIRQNLFWAFFYNLVGIPVAAGLFYKVWALTLNPMIAAAAMSFSSVSVVSNALRLRFFKPSFSRPEAAAQVDVSERRETMKKTICIEGMNCSHCTLSVYKALRGLDGVTEVKVDLAAKEALVEAEKEIDDEILRKAVTAFDFKVVDIKNA